MRPELEGDTFQGTGDKPQLHSDHLPPRHLCEMDASRAPSEADDGALPEMAANEAPARELLSAAKTPRSLRPPRRNMKERGENLGRSRRRYSGVIMLIVAPKVIRPACWNERPRVISNQVEKYCGVNDGLPVGLLIMY